MKVAFYSADGGAEDWQQELSRFVPGLDFQEWTQKHDAAEAEALLAWKLPHGHLGDFPSLKFIQCLGVGVDALMSDPSRRTDVPISRIVDPWMTNTMSEWIILNVLRFLRDDPIYQEQRRRRVWKELPLSSKSPKVGVMGLGELGGDAAAKLAALGLDVVGWSRTLKDIKDVECYYGDQGLEHFLPQCNVLCCLLPLTPETSGIIDADVLSQLPMGAFLINSARGEHVNIEDLIAAIDRNQIAGAALDVFPNEPLPKSDPLWDRPEVLITPHVAAITNFRTASQQVADNLNRVTKGLRPLNLVDAERGY